MQIFTKELHNDNLTKYSEHSILMRKYTTIWKIHTTLHEISQEMCVKMTWECQWHLQNQQINKHEAVEYTHTANNPVNWQAVRKENEKIHPKLKTKFVLRIQQLYSWKFISRYRFNRRNKLICRKLFTLTHIK
jgi:hypothetical protein